jgi:hypothetical protein
MANVPETNEWVDGVRRLEVTDPAQGGEGGIMNRQAEQLATRTQFLRKRQVLQEGNGTFTSADSVQIGLGFDTQLYGNQYDVLVTPTQDTEGSLGDVWIEKHPGHVHVHRTGEYAGAFHFVFLATLNDHW